MMYIIILLLPVTGVTLNKETLKLAKNATETLVATVLPSDAGNKNVTWSSSDDNVATVSNNGLVTAVGDSGNATITVTTVDGGHTAQCAFSISNPCESEVVSTTYEWVEIGGVKWATKNVGALKVTDYGQKFSWGGTNGYTNDQVSGSCRAFSWTDYEHGNGTSSPGATGMTKYNETDGLTVLQQSDDAATVNMGSGWRMPTTAEFQALGTATTSAWTADYEGSGVAGLVLTSKADNSKKLFFPAAGNCNNGSVNYVGSNGYHWSSSLDASDMQFAYLLSFYSGRVNWQSSRRRSFGYSVHGVVGQA